MRTFLLLSLCIINIMGFAQVTVPFTGCPNESLAIARSGSNNYAGESVNFYHVNAVTGSSVIIAGGPLKDPANTAVNMDINGVGLNMADGFLYGIQPGTTSTPNFYRMGSNYSIEKIGSLPVPEPLVSLGENMGIINAAAGEFNTTNAFYYTAVTGFLNIVTGSFTPSRYHVGKVINVSSLAASSAVLTVAYTPINLTHINCSEYLSTIQEPVSASSRQNTGLKDIAYNQLDGNLYSFVTFEYPVGSGVFKGQLLKIDPLTGIVSCYPSTVLPFVNATNEIAGAMITSDGNFKLLFTNGNLYKADVSSPGVFTGSISLLKAESVTGVIRGDLASCGAAVLLPVKFVDFTAKSKNCAVNFQWTVAQENNVQAYELQIMSENGTFISRKFVSATNSSLNHTYSTNLSDGAKVITCRVKQIDFSGQISYSKIIRIETTCAGLKTINVYYNKNANNDLQVKYNNCLSNEPVMLSIVRTDGAVLIQKKTAANEAQTLNIKMLTSGLYFLRAIFSDGTEDHKTFLK